MVQSLKQQEYARPTDPNVLQNRASSPRSSVWVGASAGSGKTKVLTDRILRLLLSETQPHKILALTFTKAAASEMAQRIQKRLSEWAVIDDKDLKKQLTKLFGGDVPPEKMDIARKLFARVIDTAGGLKIMTIHSFCQSVLGRFPLESGLSPGFKALEEDQAQVFLRNAVQQVLKQSSVEKGSPLSEAIFHIARVQNETQFMGLLQNIMGERKQVQRILNENFGADGLYTAICKKFNIPAGQSIDDIVLNACAQIDERGLRQACKALAQGSEKTDQPRGTKIQNFLDATPMGCMKIYSDYKSAFLTQKGSAHKTLATKKITDIDPNILDILQTEAARLIEIENTIKTAKTAALTRDLFIIGEAVLGQYQALKKEENALDFDDLILRTLDLLNGDTPQMKGLNVAPWIRFKLDQGIDHILVDEAQDTNPEQWEIIQALCDDFFDGQNSDNDAERTVFVVGDEKQSIFSFQRASPEKFQTMRRWFNQKIKASEKSFQTIDFNISFRSVKSILQFVDMVFDNSNMRGGLSLNYEAHESFRYTQAGQVELWPLFSNPEKEEYDPWAAPIEIIESSSGAAQMADHIGKIIEKWIKTKEILESYDRPIEAGDIMILVRSRTRFIDQLVRALKLRNIPVSGVDRMILNDQLVVQDLCAAAAFTLLPEDDLNLAALLKSPFIGWDEDQLFNIAYNRNGSLWQSVKSSGDKKTIEWLSGLIQEGGRIRPYDFFTSILQRPCPSETISGLRAIKKRLGEECLDPLDEFLNIALNYEAENTPSLQKFLQAQSQNDSQIKRQMEEGGRAVRIMTVHAAKGLQAPIVILPDTVRSAASSRPERILWPNRSGADFPYFCPQSKEVPSTCQDALNILQERDHEEYRRLFYVAMTRAENRLYIGGYTGVKKPAEESWYNYAAKAFAKLPDVENIEFGEEEILRFTNPATDKPDRAEKENVKTDERITDIPPWLFQAMPSEPFPPRPLAPSRPSMPEEPALSPLQSKNEYRFLRGNVTHKLLQILPDIPADKRIDTAKKYVGEPAHGLSGKVQTSIVDETMAVLNHPDFAAIFGENSMAEVPVTGFIHNKTLISGQIDRLLITDEEILIIDYKTNRPPPSEEKDVPAIYRHQMTAYADALRQIYPDRAVKAALIWTDGARLMPLSDI